MDAERFETLALAYGRDLGRWPAEEREAARTLLAGSPSLAAVLDEAGDLDDALDAWRTPAPSAALRERVLASAPKRRRSGFGGFGLWLSGAGFAAAAAGVVVGVAVCSAAVSDVRADGLLSAALANETAAALAGFTVGEAGGTQA